MPTSNGLNGAIDLPIRGQRRRSSPFLFLAIGLLVFSAVAGITYFILRPTTLRIAVGPSGSDDEEVIQALAQSFARDGSTVRLNLITTAGPVDRIALLAASKADLAVVRADEEMPDGTESVAIMRKNVVVLWSPSRASRKGSRRAKIRTIDDLAGHRVGVVGRTQVNPTLPWVILMESGVNPEKVTIAQFNTNQITEMVRDLTVDAFMTVGPLESRITADAIASTARLRGEPVFFQSTSRKPSPGSTRSMNPRKFPAPSSARRRPDPRTRSRRSASIT